MAAASQKIGKSLLKFFKPIKIGFPDQQEKSKSKGFQVLSFKKPEIKSEELKKETKRAEEVPPPNPDANWVEAITYIVDVCKKASDHMGHKIAVPAYKKAANSKVAQKIKFVGSIVNTDLDEAEEKFHRQRLVKEAKMQKERERLRIENGEDPFETVAEEQVLIDENESREKEIQKNLEQRKARQEEMRSKKAA